MVLIDSSAWIEFLRNGRADIVDEVDRLLESGAITCDIVVMELLAGARSETNLMALQSLTARSSFEPVLPVDYEFASVLYRTARRSGVTVRSLMDCVIAAVAIRVGVPVLHHDRDFDALASCSELRIHRLVA